MDVKKINPAYSYKNSQNNKISFQASPKQLSRFLEKAELPEQHREYLQSFVDQFIDFQKKFFKNNKGINEFTYKLGQVNYAENGAQPGQADKFLGQIDEFCNEGLLGYTRGHHFMDSMREYGVKDPDVITIKRPIEKKFSFFNLFRRNA